MRRVADERCHPDAELEKARNLRLASTFGANLQTINGKASIIGNAEVFLGDYERAFELPEALAALTTADLQAVATKTFDRQRMTVGVLRAGEAAE